MNKIFFSHWNGIVVAILFSLILQSASAYQFEIEGRFDDPFAERPATPAGLQGKETPKNSTEKKDESQPVIQPKIGELPPSYVKLYLIDGYIVSGELETNSIAIKTDFGTL